MPNSITFGFDSIVRFLYVNTPHTRGRAHTIRSQWTNVQPFRYARLEIEFHLQWTLSIEHTEYLSSSGHTLHMTIARFTIHKAKYYLYHKESENKCNSLFHIFLILGESSHGADYYSWMEIFTIDFIWVEWTLRCWRFFLLNIYLAMMLW